MLEEGADWCWKWGYRMMCGRRRVMDKSKWRWFEIIEVLNEKRKRERRRERCGARQSAETPPRDLAIGSLEEEDTAVGLHCTKKNRHCRLLSPPAFAATGERCRHNQCSSPPPAVTKRGNHKHRRRVAPASSHLSSPHHQLHRQNAAFRKPRRHHWSLSVLLPPVVQKRARRYAPSSATSDLPFFRASRSVPFSPPFRSSAFPGGSATSVVHFHHLRTSSHVPSHVGPPSGSFSPRACELAGKPSWLSVGLSSYIRLILQERWKENRR